MFLTTVRGLRALRVALASVVSPSAATAAGFFHAGTTNMSIATAVRALSGIFSVWKNVVPCVPDSDVGS